MNKHNIVTFIKLIIILAGTLLLDGLIFVFANSCSSCQSFSAFITSNYSLSAPFVASLFALFGLTRKQ